jgi:hypothetical protein
VLEIIQGAGEATWGNDASIDLLKVACFFLLFKAGFIEQKVEKLTEAVEGTVAFSCAGEGWFGGLMKAQELLGPLPISALFGVVTPC